MAMLQGIGAHGDEATVLPAAHYSGNPQADVAVFYGLKAGTRNIFFDYQRAGKPCVYIDRGYFGRKAELEMKLHAILYEEIGPRSKMVCENMEAGIRKYGDATSRVKAYQHDGRASGDVAVFYGLKDGKDQIFRDYNKAGKKVVFVDLGYFGRRDTSRVREMEFHRFTVGERHPEKISMSVDCPSDRIDRFGLEMKPWVKGDYILVAGMSRKSAHSYGMGNNEWELATIKKLKQHTDRLIIYRPKPSDKGARPIDGTRFSPREERLEGLLRNAHAVVTHHSNVSCEGLIAGVPCFLDTGIASPLGRSDISLIETPYYPDDDLRRQWLANLGYWQWNCVEMAQGQPWWWLKKSGFLY